MPESDCLWQNPESEHVFVMWRSRYRIRLGKIYFEEIGGGRGDRLGDPYVIKTSEILTIEEAIKKCGRQNLIDFFKSIARSLAFQADR